MSKKNGNPFQSMAITSSILSCLSGSTIIGIFGGKWLDEHFNTMPLFLIIGILMGLGAGTYGTLQLIRKYTGEDT